MGGDAAWSQNYFLLLMPTTSTAGMKIKLSKNNDLECMPVVDYVGVVRRLSCRCHESNKLVTLLLLLLLLLTTTTDER